MKEKLFQVFFCIYIFWAPILFSLLGNSGDELNGGIMRLALITIAVISWSFYFSFRPQYPKERKMLRLLFVFAVLYYCTQFFNKPIDHGTHQLYMGQLLRWGADCTSAVVIGMTLLKLKNYDLIHKILPYESILLTPYMISLILKNSMEYGQYIDSGGLSYQLLAYYMAILFCFSFYYTFVYSRDHSGFMKLLTLVAMLVQAVSCCMAGGRGGLVLLIVYIVYMSYFLLKQKRISKGRLITLVVSLIAGFWYFANRFNMWNSVGFQRSSSFSDTSSDRTDMWEELWHFVPDNNFLPYGLGGDYYTFGFYTHNVLLDWCIELSVIGAAFMVFLYWKTYKINFELTKHDGIFVITMILFLYGVVMNLFSGYWITTFPIWMAFGIAYTSFNYYRKH